MISTDDIIEEIRRLDAISIDGFTMHNMAKETGYNVNTCRVKLKMLIEAGKAEFVGNIREYNIAGKPCKVPVYRLVT